MQQISHMASENTGLLFISESSQLSSYFLFCHLDCLVLQLDTGRKSEAINECCTAEFVLSKTELLACMFAC